MFLGTTKKLVTSVKLHTTIDLFKILLYSDIITYISI